MNKKILRIGKLRRIVKLHQHETIDGYLVDAITANVILTVYDALNKERFACQQAGREETIQKRIDCFECAPLLKLVDVCWRCVK